MTPMRSSSRRFRCLASLARLLALCSLLTATFALPSRYLHPPPNYRSYSDDQPHVRPLPEKHVDELTAPILEPGESSASDPQNAIDAPVDVIILPPPPSPSPSLFDEPLETDFPSPDPSSDLTEWTTEPSPSTFVTPLTPFPSPEVPTFSSSPLPTPSSSVSLNQTCFSFGDEEVAGYEKANQTWFSTSMTTYTLPDFVFPDLPVQYRTHAFAEGSWVLNVPLPAGQRFLITLGFAEVYELACESPRRAGIRVFNVNIGNSSKKVDVMAARGCAMPFEIRFHNVRAWNYGVKIKFQSLAQNPMLSTLCYRPAKGSTTVHPVISYTPSPSATPSAHLQIPTPSPFVFVGKDLVFPNETYHCLNFGPDHINSYQYYDGSRLSGDYSIYSNPSLPSTDTPIQEYQSFIHGKSWTYSLVLPTNMVHQVVLGFAETSPDVCPTSSSKNASRRVFAVSIAGGTQLINVKKSAGCRKPYQVKFNSVPAENFNTDIQFKGIKGTAMLSVICFTKEPLSLEGDDDEEGVPPPSESPSIEMESSAPSGSPSSIDVSSKFQCFRFGNDDISGFKKVTDLKYGENLSYFSNPQTQISPASPYSEVYKAHIYGSGFDVVISSTTTSPKTIVFGFAEIFELNCVSEARVFELQVGSLTRIIDIYDEVGCASAFNVRIDGISPSKQGVVRISFKAFVDNALISGLCVQDSGDDEDFRQYTVEGFPQPRLENSNADVSSFSVKVTALGADIALSPTPEFTFAPFPTDDGLDGEPSESPTAPQESPNPTRDSITPEPSFMIPPKASSTSHPSGVIMVPSVSPRASSGTEHSLNPPSGEPSFDPVPSTEVEDPLDGSISPSPSSSLHVVIMLPSESPTSPTPQISTSPFVSLLPSASTSTSVLSPSAAPTISSSENTPEKSPTLTIEPSLEPSVITSPEFSLPLSASASSEASPPYSPSQLLIAPSESPSDQREGPSPSQVVIAVISPSPSLQMEQTLSVSPTLSDIPLVSEEVPMPSQSAHSTIESSMSPNSGIIDIPESSFPFSSPPSSTQDTFEESEEPTVSVTPTTTSISSSIQPGSPSPSQAVSLLPRESGVIVIPPPDEWTPTASVEFSTSSEPSSNIDSTSPGPLHPSATPVGFPSESPPILSISITPIPDASTGGGLLPPSFEHPDESIEPSESSELVFMTPVPPGLGANGGPQNDEDADIIEGPDGASNSTLSGNEGSPPPIIANGQWKELMGTGSSGNGFTIAFGLIGALLVLGLLICLYFAIFRAGPPSYSYTSHNSHNRPSDYGASQMSGGGGSVPNTMGGESSGYGYGGGGTEGISGGGTTGPVMSGGISAMDAGKASAGMGDVAVEFERPGFGNLGGEGHVSSATNAAVDTEVKTMNDYTIDIGPGMSPQVHQGSGEESQDMRYIGGAMAGYEDEEKEVSENDYADDLENGRRSDAVSTFVDGVDGDGEETEDDESDYGEDDEGESDDDGDSDEDDEYPNDSCSYSKEYGAPIAEVREDREDREELRTQSRTRRSGAETENSFDAIGNTLGTLLGGGDGENQEVRYTSAGSQPALTPYEQDAAAAGWMAEEEELEERRHDIGIGGRRFMGARNFEQLVEPRAPGAGSGDSWEEDDKGVGQGKENVSHWEGVVGTGKVWLGKDMGRERRELNPEFEYLRKRREPNVKQVASRLSTGELVLDMNLGQNNGVSVN